MPSQDGKSSGFRIMGILFLIAFLVTLVILFTDKNLQTDFGSVKHYFYHWYGLLAAGLLSLIGSLLLIALPRRSLAKVGLGGSIVIAIFLVADITTYSMVGFSSAADFATYLFGITKYPGVLSYVPGLYDVLLALYVITIIVGGETVHRSVSTKKQPS